MESQDLAASGAKVHGRSVFVSYRSLDDLPPPDNPSPEAGFVRYLWKQLHWELNQLGVPDTILWRDRGKISPGDDWSELIQQELNKADLFLAIVSRNYIQSDWCAREISTMISRVSHLDAEAQQRRIFRVDKHRISEDMLPEKLRTIQSVRFYDEDRETKRENEFFWRGKVRCYDEYMQAVHELAVAIYERLVGLGIPMNAQLTSATDAAPDLNGRTVFLAKPAGDVAPEYRVLAHDLIGRGFRVVPSPDSELPSDGEAALAEMQLALADAEVSIHLLGERRGFRPDGLDTEIVPLQLACAAAEIQRRPTFQRLIWAPRVLPRYDGRDDKAGTRDPLHVLERFSPRMHSDQIDGDTATRFGEFVLQRLKAAAAPRTDGQSVYIHCAPNDRAFALRVAREVKKYGVTPLVRPDADEDTPDEIQKAEQRLIRQARWTILCWAGASRAKIVAELTGPVIQSWRDEADDRKLLLLLGAPHSEAKAEVIELGLGPEVSLMLDATGDDDVTRAVQAQLLPAMER